MSSHDSTAINPANIDWRLVERSTLSVRQHFSYEYPGRIRNLRHQLIVFPPRSFGHQSLVNHQLTVSETGDVHTTTDAFGNNIVEFRAPAVERQIEFEALIEVERTGALTPRLLPGAWLKDPRLLAVTQRTTPDSLLESVAAELAQQSDGGLFVAEAANSWVHDHLTYGKGFTDVHTTASQALAGGRGVCQDYAHILIAMCRSIGLPCLYVSGHMLGEGGTHAWVEVVLPARDGSGQAEAWALDPTHGRRVNPTYLTVAVGRDYADVAPTSGSYLSSFRGSLSTRKSVRLTQVAYRS